MDIVILVAAATLSLAVAAATIVYAVRAYRDQI